MSGIAGLWRLDGRPVEPAELESMTARLAHRGPDGAGAWRDGPVGLGHRMLHTTPESLRERQPLVSASADLVLTADARLDNRDELCSLLPAPRSLTDAALILLAYERWGERCPEHLLGDFAFAIWDARRRLLFCARDHFGVKPLYYHHRSGQLFAFASEIKGLLALPEVPRRLNEVRVADYLVPLLEDKEITFYEEIVRLPPAHWMTVDREGIRRQEYWALDPERDIRLRSDDEYAAAFREIFTEAVRCRLRSAYPIGSMLSGGLDSSSIVCVARQLLAENGGGPLHTFSAVLGGPPEYDERPYVTAVTRGNGVRPHQVGIQDIGLVDALDSVLDQVEEPFLYTFVFAYSALYRTAREQRARTVLDGLDGDTTVSHGVSYLAELLARGRLWALVSEVSALAKRWNRSPWSFLWGYAVRPWVPDWAHRGWRKVRGRQEVAWAENGLISRAFALRVNVPARFRAQGGFGWIPMRSARECHFRRLTSGGFTWTLETLDRAASGFGIEARHPFFDRRLAEYCLALPPQQQLYRGWTRRVMRDALADLLPDDVQRRGGKTGLSPTFVQALLGSGEESLLRDLARRGDLIRRYVDVRQVEMMSDGYRQSANSGDGLNLWRVAALARWLARQAETLKWTQDGGVR